MFHSFGLFTTTEKKPKEEESSEVALFYVPPNGWTPGEMQVTPLTGADHKGLVKLETAAEREWWVTFKSQKSCFIGRNKIRNGNNSKPKSFVFFVLLSVGKWQKYNSECAQSSFPQLSSEPHQKHYRLVLF